MALVVVVVGAVVAKMVVSSPKFQSRDQLNKGVLAFKNGAYPTAVEHFKLAVSLDPSYPVSREYLAMAYYMLYVPGAESEENNRMARMAEDGFMQVLSENPNASVTMAYLAQLKFHQKKLDEAESWYRKLVGIDPSNKSAFYTLGVIAWTRTFTPRMESRAELGMRPDDPGPIRSKRVRDALRKTNLPIIEQGLQDLQKALAIDPEYDDAMAYVNLLYRERADLANDSGEYKADTDTADSWVDKTMLAKRDKARSGDTSDARSSNSSPFTDGQKVIVTVPCGCTPRAGDFSLMATALLNQDRAALASLVSQGKVLLLDGGTRAEVLASNLSGGRTHIYIESGEYIGRSCDLLTAQLQAK